MNTTQINTRSPAEIPTTQNPGWGFWGTMKEQADAAWPIAMSAISDATHQPLESVKAFLDSRHGRHFADEVSDQLLAGHTLAQSIDSACRTWMRRTTGSRTSRDYGIPTGMPHLTGFVIHCEINDEMAA